MLDDARERLHHASRVVSFSGAGLSAESGISTFRDPDGTWARHDPMKLASPQGFAEDPDLVIEWYGDRRRRLATVRPNPAHHALADRSDIIHVTQNVDDLLERAGAEDVIHLHGRIGLDRCHAGCGVVETVDLASPPGRRPCPSCSAPMRPGVVWFGESLPVDAWTRAERACASCDVLLVIGTSAAVYPAAGLIGVASGAGASVIVVNLHPSEASHQADIELIGEAGTIVPQLLAHR